LYTSIATMISVSLAIYKIRQLEMPKKSRTAPAALLILTRSAPLF
jgi:hypothetical protein